MQVEFTERGFAIARFSDRYAEPCSIQESSIAFENCIWLGRDGEGAGRMHLTQEMAAALIPLLAHFAATGDLPHHPASTQIDFATYQRAATKTALYVESVEAIDPGVEAPTLRMLVRLSYASLGLSEAGEVQNKVKKIIRDARGVITDETRAAIRKEIGDGLWYFATTCTELGIDLAEAAAENLARLQDRQTRGTLTGSGDER